MRKLLLVGLVAASIPLGFTSGYLQHRYGARLNGFIQRIRSERRQESVAPRGVWHPLPDWSAEAGFERLDTGRISPGPNLCLSAHAPEASLITADGRTVHSWRQESWPAAADGHEASKRDGNRHFWRDVALLPDGDLIALHQDLAVIRLSRDSRLAWAREGQYRNTLTVDSAGRVYAIRLEPRVLPYIHETNEIHDETLVVMDGDGNAITEVSLIDCLRNSEYEPLLKRTGYWGILLHANSLQVLEGHASHMAPAFRKGNVVVSLWFLDTVVIVDLEQRKVVWALGGPFLRQRDVVMLPGGNLLVAHNWQRPSGTELIEIDALERRIVWQVETEIAGATVEPGPAAVQRLPNGNTLVTETAAGRAVEMTPEGESVWTYVTPHKAGDAQEFVAALFKAERLAPERYRAWLRPGHAPSAEGGEHPGAPLLEDTNFSGRADDGSTAKPKGLCDG